jgi:hypothetical protein
MPVNNRLTRWLASRLATRLPPERDPDFRIGELDADGNGQLNRWYLIPRNRLFNVYLHEILRDDDDRALHDHPWWSLSLVLHGTMAEIYRRPDATEAARAMYTGALVWRRAKFAHRLYLPVVSEERSAWTLFLTGPTVRTWGFHCPRGWVPWRTYTASTGNTSVSRGCGE